MARPKRAANDTEEIGNFIQIEGGKLPEIVDKAEQLLLAGDFGLYQRSGMVVRPAMVTIDVANNATTEAHLLVPETYRHLTEVLTRAGTWVKYDARSEQLVRKDCPANVAQTYLERIGEWKLKTLSGIISAPTLRPDGSVLDTPGYDKRTGLLFDPQETQFPEIPEAPSKDDAQAAKSAILEVVRKFPFVKSSDGKEISKSVFLSFFLTALVRRSLDAAPGHGITAPVAGTGKSMLVDIVSIAATGRQCGVISQGKNSEETEKKLVGVLVAGDQIMSLDNCTEPLGGDLLCQMMTQKTVKPRILGKTGNPECLANMTIAATGNNLRMKGDMTRRWLLCELDAGVERPEKEMFDFDPREEMLKNRPALVAAGLTMMRAYLLFKKDNPEKNVETVPLGSYRAWSELVRNTLIWLDCADPVLSIEAIRDEDPERSILKSFMDQWQKLYSGSAYPARHAIDSCNARYDGDHQEFVNPDFREVLLEICGSRNGLDCKILGKWLSNNAKRPIDGVQIVKKPAEYGIQTWAVEAAGRRS